MSKNIVDVVIELQSENLGLLPSRRQIDYNGGYVNNWNTQTFSEYVKKYSDLIIERDHSGAEQGILHNDEYISLDIDSNYIDIVHVDPWKKYKNLEDGISETVKYIKFIHNKNKNVKFEVGTEESIRKFSPEELSYFIQELKNRLSKDEFENIEYVCIQSGVSLDIVEQKNNGDFNRDRLIKMIDITSKYDKKSKEHNGDYLSNDEIKKRFNDGLDSINIGPEIVQLETQLYLDNFTDTQLQEFYKVCLESRKWEKWVTKDFDITNKKMLILVCGHYCYSKYDLPNLDQEIKKILKFKINKLLSLCHD
jgi:fructose/tagatose bisphosphate aldolase